MDNEDMYSQTTDSDQVFPRLFRDLLEKPLLAHDFEATTAQAKIKFIASLENFIQTEYPEDAVLLEEFQKYRAIFKRKSDMYDLLKNCLRIEFKAQESSSSESSSDEMEVDEPEPTHVETKAEPAEPENEISEQEPVPDDISSDFEELFEDIDELIKTQK